MTATLDIHDIEDASRRLHKYASDSVIVTPLLESPLLNRELCMRLLVKAECLQPGGSFKARGAYNQILQLTKDQKERGVFAVSSGNHAQEVARAAREFGIAATILMPHDAPPLKKRKTLAYGAKVETYNRVTENREEIGARIAEERNLTAIHPYDDLRTIAGQGTIGLEIHQQMAQNYKAPNAIVVPCSGGGMTAGIAVTRMLYKYAPTVFAVEPEGFDDTRHSLKEGYPVANEKQTGTICDALTAPKPGALPFEILKQNDVKGISVSDNDVMAGMYLASEHFRLVLEPAGAIALSAIALDRKRFEGMTVVAVASGGNIDAADHGILICRGREYMQGPGHEKWGWLHPGLK